MAVCRRVAADQGWSLRGVPLYFGRSRILIPVGKALTSVCGLDFLKVKGVVNKYCPCPIKFLKLVLGHVALYAPSKYII